MATIAEQIELLPQIVSDTRTTNYLTLAAFVIFLYDMVLTFPRELEFVWKARWTTGKVLFIVNRYPVFFISVFLLVYMFDYYSALDLSVCIVSNYIEAWSMLALIIPVQVILVLRTLALWGQNRMVLVFLLVALLATDSTIIVSMAFITKSLSFQDRPATKQVLGCYGSLNDISISNAIPSWVALITFDTIVFVLTIVRVEGIRRTRKDQSRLLHILFRDGILFYLIMLASSAANLALYACLPFRRRGLIICLIPLLRTVMSVCTARLLLNLREAAVVNGNCRMGEGWNWALGELEGEEGVENIESTSFTFTRTAVSSELMRQSFLAPRLSRHVDDLSLSAGVHNSAAAPSSERGRIIVSVSTQAEEYRDEGDASVPSSFRIAVLNRLTSIANDNIELGQLR